MVNLSGCVWCRCRIPSIVSGDNFLRGFHASPPSFSLRASFCVSQAGLSRASALSGIVDFSSDAGSERGRVEEKDRDGRKAGASGFNGAAAVAAERIERPKRLNPLEQAWQLMITMDGRSRERSWKTLNL